VQLRNVAVLDNVGHCIFVNVVGRESFLTRCFFVTRVIS
jgi:hypothetical protein